MKGRGVALAVCLGAVACAAEAPPPAPVPPKREAPPPSVEATVRTCAMLASCARRDDPAERREPATCVTRMLSLQASDVTLACVRNARSCADVDRCVGRDHADEARRACDSRPGTIAFCDGPRLVSCGERPDVRDCGEVAGFCRELNVSNGIVVRGCFSSKWCGAGLPSRCDGDVAIVTCQDALAERTRCPTGTRCEEQPNAEGGVEARCRPVGSRPCVPGGISRCDGDTLVTCMAGEDGRGALVETDCAAAGLTCRTSGRDAGCSAGAACAEGPAWCDGGALRLCAAGVPVRARCEGWGLRPCEVRDGVASCQPSR